MLITNSNKIEIGKVCIFYKFEFVVHKSEISQKSGSEKINYSNLERILNIMLTTNIEVIHRSSEKYILFTFKVKYIAYFINSIFVIYK